MKPNIDSNAAARGSGHCKASLQPTRARCESGFAERRSTERTLPLKLMRIADVTTLTGLSRSSVYAAVKLGAFPAPINIGIRASAWIQDEVHAWMRQRIRATRCDE